MSISISPGPYSSVDKEWKTRSKAPIWTLVSDDRSGALMASVNKLISGADESNSDCMNSDLRLSVILAGDSLMCPFRVNAISNANKKLKTC